jgi:hypothetical protein
MNVPDTSTFHVKLPVCDVMSMVLMGVNVLLSGVYETVMFAPEIKGDIVTVIVTFCPVENDAGEVESASVLFDLVTSKD